MDIITHSLTGAITGSIFGHPVAGAVLGAAPDLVLGFKRKERPTTAYNSTHSVTFLVLATLVAVPFGYALLVFACLLSHIVLDIPTHGKRWGPPLFYPFSQRRYSWGNEWEWFNDDWFFGLAIAIIWCVLCQELRSLYATGCPLFLSAQSIDSRIYCMYPSFLTPR